MIFNKIALRLSIPVSINDLYKQGKHGWYKNQKAVDWQNEALWNIKKQTRGMKLVSSMDSVAIRFFRKDKRRFDIDGPIKLLLDTLVKAGIFKDDYLIRHLEVDKYEKKENQCEVFIW